MYQFVKLWIRAALQFYCRRIVTINNNVPNESGPILLAANHPNSFLDAIIIGSRFEQPVHFLARGDAFRKPQFRWILNAMNLVPIYRLTEGKENLALNEATFQRCRDILLENGILLIFSEGLCVQEHKLRELKKGTARIALDAWQQNEIAEQFKVIPVAIQYNAFNKFGKTVLINFCEPFNKPSTIDVSGTSMAVFNTNLTAVLKDHLREEEAPAMQTEVWLSNINDAGQSTQSFSQKNKASLFAPYYISQNIVADILFLLLLFIAALIGFILYAPLYYFLKEIIRNKTTGTVFYDSALFGALLITTPLYYVLINVVGFLLSEETVLQIVLLVSPLAAWITCRYKERLIGVLNYFKISS